VSLILEALKKAEAERRLGQSPTLASDSPWRPRERSRWQPIALGVLLLATGAGLTALFLQSRVPTTTEPAPQATRAPSAATAPNVPATRAEAREPGKAPSTPTASTAPAAARKPVAATSASDPNRADAQIDTPARPATTRAQPSTPVIPPPERSPARPRDTDVYTVTTDTSSVQHLTPSVAPPEGPADEPLPAAPAALPPPLPAASEAPQAAPARASTRPPPSDAPLKTITDLDPGTRKAMPALKLTLHYFHAEPARRFVVLNGNRANEGTLVDGVRILEIRPDGVVLELNGEPFLLPRAGG